MRDAELGFALSLAAKVAREWMHVRSLGMWVFSHAWEGANETSKSLLLIKLQPEALQTLLHRASLFQPSAGEHSLASSKARGAISHHGTARAQQDQGERNLQV